MSETSPVEKHLEHFRRLAYKNRKVGDLVSKYVKVDIPDPGPYYREHGQWSYFRINRFYDDDEADVVGRYLIFLVILSPNNGQILDDGYYLNHDQLVGLVTESIDYDCTWLDWMEREIDLRQVFAESTCQIAYDNFRTHAWVAAMLGSDVDLPQPLPTDVARGISSRVDLVMYDTDKYLLISQDTYRHRTQEPEIFHLSKL